MKSLRFSGRKIEEPEILIRMVGPPPPPPPRTGQYYKPSYTHAVTYGVQTFDVT
jgi:hypothetical protein